GRKTGSSGVSGYYHHRYFTKPDRQTPGSLTRRSRSLPARPVNFWRRLICARARYRIDKARCSCPSGRYQLGQYQVSPNAKYSYLLWQPRIRTRAPNARPHAYTYVIDTFALSSVEPG